jgi:hypothetical protein
MEQILALQEPDEKELESGAPDSKVETAGGEKVEPKRFNASSVFDEIAAGAVSHLTGKA